MSALPTSKYPAERPVPFEVKQAYFTKWGRMAPLLGSTPCLTNHLTGKRERSRLNQSRKSEQTNGPRATVTARRIRSRISRNASELPRDCFEQPWALIAPGCLRGLLLAFGHFLGYGYDPPFRSIAKNVQVQRGTDRLGEHQLLQAFGV